MSDQDNVSLVPAERRELAPVTKANPLVSRGLAALAARSSATERNVEFPILDEEYPFPVSVLLTQIGDNLYRIDEIPLLLCSPIECANYLDVIEVEPGDMDGHLRFIRIAKPSGWRTFQYCISSPIIVEGKWGQSLLRDLEARGGKWVRVWGFLIISLPPGLDHESEWWVPSLANIEEAIRLDPKCADAYYERGIDRAWTGLRDEAIKDIDEAIKDFDEAIRLDPTKAVYFQERAVAWSGKEVYSKAIADLTEAIRLDPRNSDLYIRRGAIWMRTSDYDNAITDYDDSLRLDTFDEFGRQELSRLLSAWAESFAEAGFFDAAIRYQSKAVEAPEYQGPDGDHARRQLELYKQKKPFRQDP